MKKKKVLNIKIEVFQSNSGRLCAVPHCSMVNATYDTLAKKFANALSPALLEVINAENENKTIH